MKNGFHWLIWEIKPESVCRSLQRLLPTWLNRALLKKLKIKAKIEVLGGHHQYSTKWRCWLYFWHRYWLYDEVKNIFANAGVNYDKVLGVGVSLPGIIQGPEGLSQTYFNFSDEPLENLIKRKNQTRCSNNN